MSNKTEKLDHLFAEWRDRYGKAAKDFAEDGIIDETAWDNAPRKVLFLMKETNKFGDDLRKLVRKGPWKVPRYWAFGLQHVKREHIPTFGEAKEHFQKACRSSAIMNLKKLTGKGISNPTEIQEAAKRDLSFVQREIEIIRPEVVISCGTFGIVREVFPGFAKVKAIDPDGRCFMVNDAIWIDYCHPSVRLRHDMMYYALVMHYYNCLGK